ncbi:MAG: hypothetical protein ABFC62_05530 [Clostridiaceae bacterium]|nr:hypothetical protein [Eubacteriales bacterium]
MEVILILFFVAVAMLIDFFPYRKKESAKEKVLFLALLAVGMCVLILHTLGVKVPSPADPIKKLVEAVFGPQS